VLSTAREPSVLLHSHPHAAAVPSRPGESPRSGDGFLPGWRQAWAGAGSAVGLLLGGILTTYASWRWVMFVNVPIGIVVAAAAPRVLAESPRRPGRIDVAGAVTGTGGVALLVYGLSKAATGADGMSHWGDAQVRVSVSRLRSPAVSLIAPPSTFQRCTGTSSGTMTSSS
jgi:MFS family permease